MVQMKKLLLLLLFIPFIAKAQTLTFACGLECSETAIHVSTSTATSFNTNSSFVRSGARSLRQNPSATTPSANITLTSVNIWVIRYYVYFATLPNANVMLGYPNNSFPYAVVYQSSDSKIYCGSRTDFGGTGVSVTTGQWYRIDIRVNTSANPWVIDAQVDGSALTQKTAVVAAESASQFFFNSGINVTEDIYFDDITFSNTSGDYPIGGGYVNHFVPTSDGTHNVAGASDFGHGTAGADITNATTDAWTLVDDVPMTTTITTTDLISILAPPNATDYVECVFGPASGISTPTNPPRIAQFIMLIHQAGTGTGNMEIRLNDNGSMGTLYTATTVAGTPSIQIKNATIIDPPSAATSWTLSGNGNFNAIRMRFGSPAAVDANPDQYLDAIMIEAEFQEQNLTVPGTPSDKRHTTLGVGF